MRLMTWCVSVAGHYINSRPSVQAWMALCCEFPAFLVRMAQITELRLRVRACALLSGGFSSIRPPGTPRRAKAKDSLEVELNLQLKIS